MHWKRDTLHTLLVHIAQIAANQVFVQHSSEHGDF